MTVAAKETTESNAPVGAALIAQAMDRREGAGRMSELISNAYVRSDNAKAQVEVKADQPVSVARGEFVAPPRDGSVPAPRPGGLPYRAAKRVFDVAFSPAVVAVGLVPGALLCAAIALDSPGTPFFRQERVGKGGKRIYIWKFRTMTADAHVHPERYMTPGQLEEWKREQKLDDDPRVTRVGRFLRKYSIDEFPQFLNVLTGDLSVIGPRPVTVEETYEFGDARDEFLSCKPGITGWWQVTDRNDATWANGDRQLLELFYVRHASLALDLRIFVRTFKAMAGGTGK